MGEPLSSRERVRAALNHVEPDRVPIDFGSSLCTGIVLAGYRRLKDYLGIDVPDVIVARMFQVVAVDERILEELGIDFRPVFYGPPRNWQDVVGPGDTYVDEWGIRYRRPEKGFYYDIIEHPLKDATIDDLETYEWPDPHDAGRYEGIEERARKLHKGNKYALVGPGMSVGFFELSWYLRGFEQLMLDLYLNPDFVEALWRKILDVRLTMLGEYLKRVGEYLDVVSTADDVATQKGPMISLELYRKMVKPFVREVYSFIRARTNAKIFYHSCGGVVPYLEDLIDCGLDALNPVQVSAKGMDTKNLKARFGDRITFWGAIDTQHVLPHGTPGDVEQEVKKRIRDLAPGGGYVVAAVHAIQPDVPPQNVTAMFEAARRYGRYPITID